MRVEKKEVEYFITRDGLEFSDSRAAIEHEYKLNDESEQRLAKISEKLEVYTSPYFAIDTLIEDGRSESDYYRVTVTDGIVREELRSLLDNNLAMNDYKNKNLKCSRVHYWKDGITSMNEIETGQIYIVCVNQDLGLYVYSLSQLLGRLTSEIHTAFYGVVAKEEC